MRVALPVQDDSTLIFAAKIGSELERRGHMPLYIHVLEKGISESKISDRQLSLLLNDRGLDAVIPEDAFMNDGLLASFDAVISCKHTGVVRRRLAGARFRNRRNRPRFIAFQPGLEFTPEKGVKNRLWFDAVFLNTPADRDLFIRHARRGDDQHVSYGHPYFITPQAMRRPAADAPIYFFAQAISPLTLNSRLHILHMLYALAHRYPQRRVVIKLRHLPEENTHHVHKELFSYPWLMERMGPPPPPNLVLDAGTMDEALSQAGYAITCTSTAAMDAISAGVPTFVYLDYVENYHDKYAALMRNIFIGSNLIAPLSDVLRLNWKAPRSMWMDHHFRDISLYDELENVMRGSVPFAAAA